MRYSRNSMCWLSIRSTDYSKLQRNSAFSVLVVPTSPCWIHISTDYSALTACYKRIVGATWHSQHILLLAANTFIFCFYDGALLKFYTRWRPHQRKKERPSPHPPTKYLVLVLQTRLLQTLPLRTDLKQVYLNFYKFYSQREKRSVLFYKYGFLK